MSDDLIQRAREALVDVSRGPWKAAWESVDPEWAIVTGPGGGIVANVNDADQSAAHFICAARDLVPAMADRLEAQEALLREAMEALERTDNASPDGTQDERQIAMNFMATLDENRATLAKLRSHMGETE